MGAGEAEKASLRGTRPAGGLRRRGPICVLRFRTCVCLEFESSPAPHHIERPPLRPTHTSNPTHTPSTMFKHVTKSRKLAKHQREARLSDEDSSGASASEPELDSASDASGSDASDSEGSDSDSEFEKDEPETPEEDELLSPAPGYPTIEEALANPIAQPTHEEGKDGELVEAQGLAPVCVVCVNKVLKAGTMLEVHKKSKVSSNSSAEHTQRRPSHPPAFAPTSGPRRRPTNRLAPVALG